MQNCLRNWRKMVEEYETLAQQIQDILELDLIDLTDSRSTLDRKFDNCVKNYFGYFESLHLKFRNVNASIEIWLNYEEKDDRYGKRPICILFWRGIHLPDNDSVLENLNDLHPEIQKLILTNLDFLDNNGKYADKRRWDITFK